MKQFLHKLALEYSLPVCVSPQKVIRKCNYANDIKSPLKSEFMYLSLVGKKERFLPISVRSFQTA